VRKAQAVAVCLQERERLGIMRVWKLRGIGRGLEEEKYSLRFGGRGRRQIYITEVFGAKSGQKNM
jgi:hypothetical protein